MVFHCPRCGPTASLGSKGLYNYVRLVLDVHDYYYLASELMYCKVCSSTYIAWDQRMLDQLSDGVRAHFPAVLTLKYACDHAIATLLRGRTLGNSPTAMRHNIMEVHSDKWLRKNLAYLSACRRHKMGLLSLQQPVPVYEEAPMFPKFPSPTWFLAVHVKDVWSRLPALLAAATSIHGKILKIDSSKKVCKKLQGADADTTSWATSIGNERGEIVATVITESEGVSALQRLADGLIDRYRLAGQEAPLILYTDRDCCTPTGPSKLKVQWPARMPCIFSFSTGSL